MKAVFIIVGIIIFIAALAIARCIYELHCLVVTKYLISSDKIPPKDSIRMIFISDLHCRTYGDDGKRLPDMIRQQKPDCILIGGDIFVCKSPEKDERAMEFLKTISSIAPVYMAPGNHEKGIECIGKFKERCAGLKEEISSAQIRYLNNESIALNEHIVVAGLDADYRYYKKFGRIKPSPETLESYVGKADKKIYNILLAHNPAWYDICSDLGYDLTLSGHYHGGAIRLPLVGGVVSPQFKLFPKYSKGIFKKQGSTLIVSGGCGSHTVNIRIFNKPEILLIEIKGTRDKD